MKVVYRYWLGNVALAAVVVGVALLFGIASWDPDWGESAVMRWWSLPPVTLFAGILVIRCLRWGVTVDDVGITRREPLATTFVPWTSLVAVEFRSASAARLELRDGRTIFVNATARGGQPSLPDAYARVRERWYAVGVEAQPYPTSIGRGFTIAFCVSSVAVVLGGLVWDDADHDADVYAARARREREATAVITKVRVGEHTNDGDTTYTTHVDARLSMPDETKVPLKLQRAGDHRATYVVDESLPIVYDSAYPRDADFADRPNRDANDDSVALRQVTGPLLYWSGLVGAIGSGIVIVVAWRRSRRPATRKTSPMPR